MYFSCIMDKRKQVLKCCKEYYLAADCRKDQSEKVNIFVDNDFPLISVRGKKMKMKKDR